MSRLILDVLGMVVLGSGLAATVFKVVLLVQAIQSSRDTRDTPFGSPDRVVAEDELIEVMGRLLAALLILALGVIWAIAVFNAPPRETGEPPISALGVALAAVLVALAVLTALQGVRGLLYRKRLRDAMLAQRAPCGLTTFSGCPYVTPERLEELSQQAQAVASTMEHLSSEHALPAVAGAAESTERIRQYVGELLEPGEREAPAERQLKVGIATRLSELLGDE